MVKPSLNITFRCHCYPGKLTSETCHGNANPNNRGPGHNRGFVIVVGSLKAVVILSCAPSSAHPILFKILSVQPATMSCGLVGEDFTAEYFLSRTSDNESGSEDSESSIDDSPDPDTDEESVSSDGNAPAPFQWQSMVSASCFGATFEEGIHWKVMPISASEGLGTWFERDH